MQKEYEIEKQKRYRHRHQKGKQHSKVILIGNPNVGKSVIFGLLTGKYVTVSNYPGTTVEVSYGNISIGDRKFILIDSPGVNNLTPMSEDEKVTRDILIREKAEAVVLVADAKNLKRAIMLLIQLAEMNLPCVLDLNMEDEAKARGIEIDYQKLSSLLNIEVVGTIAPQKKGINTLKEAILNPGQVSIKATYNSVIEEYTNKISAILPDSNISRRSIALMILSGDESLKRWLMANLNSENIKKIEELRDEAQSKLKEPISSIINNARIKSAEEIVKAVQKQNNTTGGKLLQILNSWAIHSFWGIPILLLVISAFYLFVGKFGAGILVDFFDEIIFGRYIAPVIDISVKSILPKGFFQDMLIGKYGIFTMALTYAIGIILPITSTFFIAFGFLEDSGYLPRLAVVSDRAFRVLGLNGKAILPMILGLGCGTMATMSTRILETKREKIIATFLIALAIPCSAQLGVVFGMLGPLSIKAVLWWSSCIILVLMLTGYLASKFVPGEKPDFFIELPPLRMPSFMNIIIKTLSRIEWYLKEAVPLFILGTFILFILDRINVLVWIENFASPVVVSFLGLPPKATEALIMGFLRRDYGAAGLFDMARQGLLNEIQIVVSLVTLTLFVPCLANFFMIIKERGIKTAILMMSLIMPFAILVGGLLNFIMQIIY
ncbi:MAG: ferrous iron transport protein B [Nitrospirae bacterium]|nr:ferrous iron transport protein B [Nitrospirota bacterium]